jgi:signal transduction histidine kinase/CheY-like chemotaxis protein
VERYLTVVQIHTKWNATLIPLFYFEKENVIFGIIALLLFEGISNIRVPIFCSIIREDQKVKKLILYFTDFLSPDRVLRQVLAAFIYISTQVYGENLWFFPYFIASALVYSGVTNICPMLFALKKLGLHSKIKNTNLKNNLALGWQQTIAVKISSLLLWPLFLISFAVTVYFSNMLHHNFNDNYNTKFNQALLGVVSHLNSADKQTEIVQYLKTSLEEGNFIGAKIRVDGFEFEIGNSSKDLIQLDKDLTFPSGIKIYFQSYFERPEPIIYKLRKNVIVGVGLVILLLGVVVGFIVNRFIHRPIQKLIQATQKAKDGDLEVRIFNQNKDEIGELSRFFDEMLDKTQKKKNSLIKINEELVLARDEAIRSNRARGAFLANMSHEIRTPLTSIIGYAEAILRGKGDEKSKKHFVRTIIRSGKHLMKIINDILDLSKIESEKYEIEIIKTDFPTLLDEVIDNVRYAAELKGLSFQTNLHYPLPHFVQTDPTRLKQILLNLGNNAVKFTKKGSVTFQVFCFQDKEQLYFKMTDTGIGMTPSEQKKVFSAFIQADNSTSRKFGGTGLGLYISKQLSNMLGGDIEVSGEKGKGSCFCLTVACDDLKEERLFDTFDHLEKDEEAPLELVELSGNILLVEDLDDLQELALMFLEDMGLTVDTAKNGYEAIQKMIKNGDQYDLILLDIQMPLISGIETIKTIKRLGIDIPVIALSGNAMKTDIEYYLSIGFDECLAKPIDWNLVGLTLKNYLNTHWDRKDFFHLQQKNILKMKDELQSHLEELVGEDKKIDDKNIQYWLENLYILSTITGHRALIELAREWESALVSMDIETQDMFIQEVKKLIKEDFKKVA